MMVVFVGWGGVTVPPGGINAQYDTGFCAGVSVPGHKKLLNLLFRKLEGKPKGIKPSKGTACDVFSCLELIFSICKLRFP